MVLRLLFALTLAVPVTAFQVESAEIRVRIETELGAIVLALDAKRAPLTVANDAVKKINAQPVNGQSLTPPVPVRSVARVQ